MRYILRANLLRIGLVFSGTAGPSRRLQRTERRAASAANDMSMSSLGVTAAWMKPFCLRKAKSFSIPAALIPYDGRLIHIGDSPAPRC